MSDKTGNEFIVKHWRNLSINAQMLIVYCSVLLISIVSLSLMNYYRVNDILKNKELENTHSVLVQVRSVVDTNLKLVDRLSYVVFSNDRVIDILRKNPINFDGLSVREQSDVENLLYDLLFTREDLGGVLLYNSAGATISTRPERLDIPFEYLSKQADIADGRLIWLDSGEESSFLSAVRKIYDHQMRPIGYLRLDIRKNRWLNLLAPSFSERNGSILVFNRNKIILKGNPDFPETESVMFAALSESLIEQDENIIVSVDSLVNEWQYTGIIPLSEVFRDTIAMRTYILLNTLAALAIFSVISLFVTRKLTSPLHDIAEHMKSIYLRDWKPRFSYSGNNEIAYLTDQFNEMGLRLSTMADELVEKESLQMKQQFETLQAQINPHFLYNTLDIVSWMALRHQLPDISRIVSSLSDMMRYSISSSSESTLKDEISHVKNYLAIQELRFSEKFQYQFDIEETLLGVSIPRLILQPLVENSILHGFKGKKSGGLLSIAAGRTETGMFIKVEDNGIGIAEEKTEAILDNPETEKGKGIGLLNVHRRLILSFGEKSGLNIDSRTGRGTAIRFGIPLKENSDDQA